MGGTGLWHEEDGFYYDQLLVDGTSMPLRLRSVVGLIPLFAVEFIEEGRLDKLPGFAKRTRWFLENRKDLAAHISYMARDGGDPGRRLLAIPTRERLERVLRYVFDEAEFLSPTASARCRGPTATSPSSVEIAGETYRVDYEPGESRTWLFGGNSNWRGPVWFPINYLLIEALQRYHLFYGDTFTMEFPTGSGKRMNLEQIARELARRLISLFMPDAKGKRPAMAGQSKASLTTVIGGSSCGSTNISMGTRGRAWGPITRPDGPPWSPASSRNSLTERALCRRVAVEPARRAMRMASSVPPYLWDLIGRPDEHRTGGLGSAAVMKTNDPFLLPPARRSWRAWRRSSFLLLLILATRARASERWATLEAIHQLENPRNSRGAGRLGELGRLPVPRGRHGRCTPAPPSAGRSTGASRTPSP